MNIQIAKLVLNEIQSKLGRVLSGNNTAIPILDSVKIEANANDVQFTASNGMDSVVVNLKLERYTDLLVVDTNGAVCIPKKAFGTLSKLKDGMITLKVDGSQIIVQQKKVELAFPTFSVDEYPNVMPIGQPTMHFTMNHGIFNDIVTDTTFAAATSDSRPVLQGVNLQAQQQEDGVAFTASVTDSHRLAQVNSVNKINESLPKTQVTIPAASMAGILKSFVKSDVGIAIYPNAVAFVNTNVVAIVRLIEGKYPEVSSLVPPKDKDTYSVKVSTKEIIDSLELIKSLKESNCVVLKFDKESILVQSRVLTGSGSKAKQEIQLLETTAADFEMGVSTEFLLSALKTVDTEYTTLELHGPMKPFLVQRNYAENDVLAKEVIQLVLPMRVS